MKIPTILALLVASLPFMVVQSLSAATKTTTVKGVIYSDTNGNNLLDLTEKGRTTAQVWLYRVFPNGRVDRIRTVATSASGGYSIPNVPYGTYFLSVRYLRSSSLQIRTNNFTVGAVASSATRNVPLVTAATLASNPLYAAAYTSVVRADKLAKGPDGPTTPFSP